MECDGVFPIFVSPCVVLSWCFTSRHTTRKHLIDAGCERAGLVSAHSSLISVRHSESMIAEASWSRLQDCVAPCTVA